MAPFESWVDNEEISGVLEIIRDRITFSYKETIAHYDWRTIIRGLTKLFQNLYERKEAKLHELLGSSRINEDILSNVAFC